MTFVLQAQHIGKSFRHPDGSASIVLGDINLGLESGEVVCLLGASGCGKTTLLRILAGLDPAFEGRVETGIARPGYALGYMSQNDRLLPWRSAVANVSLGLELLGRPPETAHISACDALALVGLAGFEAHYPAQLSGGMQQRVLLARMLALRPELLLLDEPMNGLDVLARRELSEIIKNYTRTRNAATLVITHSVEEACFLADRILLITRSPARIAKEICLTDDKTNDGACLERSKALDVVMGDLWNALGAAA